MNLFSMLCALPETKLTVCLTYGSENVTGRIFGLTTYVLNAWLSTLVCDWCALSQIEVLV